jgi:tight adherence protein B
VIEIGVLLLVVALFGAGLWSLRSVYYRRLTRSRLAAQPMTEAPPVQRQIVGRSYRQATWFYPVLVAAVVFAGSLLLRFKLPIAVSLVLLALAVCGLLIQLWRDRRDGIIQAQLADAIDVIIGAVRAGSSSTVALDAAMRASAHPLRSHLETLLGRIRLGDSTREVVNDLARNVPLETFRLFAFTFGVHWEAGGSLAPALRITARSVRDRIEVSRRMRAQTAEMSASLLGITLIVYILGYFMWKTNPVRTESFLASVIGAYTVASSIGLQACGFLWVRHLMKFKY